MSERSRRNEITGCGGDVTSLVFAGGEARAIVKFRNRGDMNRVRRSLVAKGWRVLTDGVTMTATAEV